MKSMSLFYFAFDGINFSYQTFLLLRNHKTHCKADDDDDEPL